MLHGQCWSFDTPSQFTSNAPKCPCRVCAAVGQRGMKILAGKAGKRLWMSEYASGDFPVTDISTGLKLSIQVSTLSGSQTQSFLIVC